MMTAKHSFLTREGFTLVELLLAVVILVVGTVLSAQILNSASNITHRGILQRTRDGCARMVFERMSLDFKAALRRNDIDYLFQKQSGNDLMAFYSQASGFYPTGVTGLKPKSTVTLVGYRIENNRLMRLAKSLVWNGVTNSTPSTSGLPGDGVSMVFSPVTLSTQWSLTAMETDSDCQIFSAQVFRLEFCFLTKESTFSGLFNPVNSIAVVVTLALCSDRNLSSGFDLTQFAGTLPDGDTPGIADEWTELVSKMTADGHGSAPDIRIYQRLFQLGAIP